MTRPRVVVVAPAVPIDASPHAGGRYLKILVTTASECADVTVVVPNTPASRSAALSPGTPESFLIADLARPRQVSRRALRRAVAVAQGWLRHLDPGLPSLSLGVEILRRGPVRDAVAGADIVDLQWSESIRLVRLVRRVNPRARVVGTFHDVESQLFARQPAVGVRQRLRRGVAVSIARRYERRGVAALDEVAVFSRKDVTLLGNPPHARVILPPLATGAEPPAATPTGPPTVVFVAHFARSVNEDAAQWLLREVWPTVRDTVPGARLRLVGRDVSDGLAAELAEHGDVTATGFVADLGAEYAAAHVAVIPLRQGAGVKFKTIEALLHGVPVVTTAVGAEGIDGPGLFAAVDDTAAGFARAVVDALTDPAPALARAAAAQTWTIREYSRETFADTLAQNYGIA